MRNLGVVEIEITKKMPQNKQKSKSKNNKKPYKIYMYLSSYGMGGMISRRLKIAQQWMDNACIVYHGKTFFQADKAIHSDNYNLFITDNDSYYKLIKDISAFKVKLEKDFFSSLSDPLLDIKPLYYFPKNNTLHIRCNSAHNSRFLYEILKLVLMPPEIIIHTDKIEDGEKNDFFISLRSIIKSILPYVRITHCKEDISTIKNSSSSCHISITKRKILQNHSIDQILPFSIVVNSPANEIKKKILTDVQSNNFYNKDSSLLKNKKGFVFTMKNKSEIINFLWMLNDKLETKGFMNLYNDKDEISRAYSKIL